MFSTKSLLIFSTIFVAAMASNETEGFSCPDTRTIFLGCFKASVETLPKTLDANNTENSKEFCTERCRSQGFQYAGMKGGDCHCGHLQPLDSEKRTDPNMCNYTCPGNDRQKCGGETDAISRRLRHASYSIYWVQPDGCGWRRIVETSDHPSGNYHASNVLFDSCGDYSTTHGPGKITWWVAPQNGANQDASFIVELGCPTVIDRVVLRNSGITFSTHTSWAAGVNGFLVSTSADMVYWQKVASGSLNYVGTTSCEKQGQGKVIYTFDAHEAKYVRFTATSFYGGSSHAAALQFFDVMGPQCDCKPQA